MGDIAEFDWWSLQMRRVSELEVGIIGASNRRCVAISISRLGTVISVRTVASQWALPQWERNVAMKGDVSDHVPATDHRLTD